MKPSTVRRCKPLAANRAGRDFVVGDLHGHRALLESALDRLHFDTTRDRLLSVGDLVDRGPDSLATLSLIEEPWFHAVLGNHELMLLAHLGLFESRRAPRKPYAEAGGAWVQVALQRHRKRLWRLAEQVAALPLVLHVADDEPFQVTHGDLLPLAEPLRPWPDAARVPAAAAEAAACSRMNVTRALARPLLGLEFQHHAVQITDRPFGDGPLTYAGHSPLPLITVHAGYVYVDQGACARPLSARTPTVLPHRAFAAWLRGVGHARHGTLQPLAA